MYHINLQSKHQCEQNCEDVNCDMVVEGVPDIIRRLTRTDGVLHAGGEAVLFLRGHIALYFN